MKHNWEYKRLGEVCSFERGITYDKSDESNYPTNVGILRSNNISLDTCSLNFDEIRYLNPDFYIKPSKIIKRDTILICMSNSLEHLGKVAYVNEDYNFGFGGFMGLIKPENIQPKYLFYFFRCPIFQRFLKSVNRGVNIRNLQFAKLSNIKMPVPPMEVQEQIVAELDKLNEMIAIRKEQLKELDNLAQSLFYDTFGDPVSNPKGWKLKPLKEATTEMFLGPFGSALKTECYVTGTDAFAMVYEQKHAIKGTLEQENHFINKEKFNSLKRFEVIPGDFIMSCRGTIGKIFQVPPGAPMGIIHPSLMKIRLKQSVYSPKLFLFFLPLVMNSQQTKGNCVQMAITAKELGAKILPVPPLSLQENFNSQVETIEKQKEIIEESIVELQTLLDSRMDYWFN